MSLLLIVLAAFIAWCWVATLLPAPWAARFIGGSYLAVFVGYFFSFPQSLGRANGRSSNR